MQTLLLQLALNQHLIMSSKCEVYHATPGGREFSITRLFQPTSVWNTMCPISEQNIVYRWNMHIGMGILRQFKISVRWNWRLIQLYSFVSSQFVWQGPKNVKTLQILAVVEIYCFTSPTLSAWYLQQWARLIPSKASTPSVGAVDYQNVKEMELNNKCKDWKRSSPCPAWLPIIPTAYHQLRCRHYSLPFQ